MAIAKTNKESYPFEDLTLIREQLFAQTREDAKQLNIPYDESTDLLKLQNRIDEYGKLLVKAEEYNIEWNVSEYEPDTLQQKIDSYEADIYAAEKDLRN